MAMPGVLQMMESEFSVTDSLTTTKEGTLSAVCSPPVCAQ